MALSAPTTPGRDEVNASSLSVSGLHCDAHVLKALVDAACAAPSADNNQPWKFATSENQIVVFLDSKRCLPSDRLGLFDLLSLGAAIENICLQCGPLGLSAGVAVNPEFSITDAREAWVARVSTHPSDEGFTHPLQPYIYDRQTSRTGYSKSPIDTDLLRQIASDSCDEKTQLDWLNDRASIRQFADLIAVADSLRFRHQPFHAELFRQLRLTEDAAEQSRDGLDYRTLGLPIGGRLSLKVLSSWNLTRRLNQFGLSKLIAAPAASLAKRSAAIGLISVADASPESLIAGGRCLQRAWLMATKEGLLMHPLGSLPIFLAESELPTHLATCAKRLRKQAGNALPIGERLLQIAFRIGRGKPTPVRSLRRRAEQVITNNQLN